MKNMYALHDLSKTDVLERINRDRTRMQLVARLGIGGALLVLLGSVWVFAAIGFTWQTGIALGVTFWTLLIAGWSQGWLLMKSDEDLEERAEQIATEREAKPHIYRCVKCGTEDVRHVVEDHLRTEHGGGTMELVPL